MALRRGTRDVLDWFSWRAQCLLWPASGSRGIVCWRFHAFVGAMHVRTQSHRPGYLHDGAAGGGGHRDFLAAVGPGMACFAYRSDGGLRQE